MASLDQVSIAILLGAVLVMAGILSSLLALPFGPPLLLVFLVIGMLAGDSGPGRLQFDDVRSTYLVGSGALAVILFDGGLRTRFQQLRPRGTLCALPQLARGAAGRRRRGLDRRGRSVPAGACAGPAPAPAGRRDA